MQVPSSSCPDASDVGDRCNEFDEQLGSRGSVDMDIEANVIPYIDDGDDPTLLSPLKETGNQEAGDATCSVVDETLTRKKYVYDFLKFCFHLMPIYFSKQDDPPGIPVEDCFGMFRRIPTRTNGAQSADSAAVSADIDDQGDDGDKIEYPEQQFMQQRAPPPTKFSESFSAAKEPYPTDYERRPSLRATLPTQQKECK